MKKLLIIVAVLAVTLASCGKKEKKADVGLSSGRC